MISAILRLILIDTTDQKWLVVFLYPFLEKIIFYDLYKNEMAIHALSMSACTMRISKHDIYMTMIKK